MYGISPKLPLAVDDVDGTYTLNKTLIETVKQNLKNLLLTAPGERVMEPDFGVGLKKYLFDPSNYGIESDIESRILIQSKRYLPFVEIEEISFDTAEQSEEILNIHIRYIITPIETPDVLVLNSDLN